LQGSWVFQNLNILANVEAVLVILGYSNFTNTVGIYAKLLLTYGFFLLVEFVWLVLWVGLRILYGLRIADCRLRMAGVLLTCGGRGGGYLGGVLLRAMNVSGQSTAISRCGPERDETTLVSCNGLQKG